MASQGSRRLLATLAAAAARCGGRRLGVVVLYHRIVEGDPPPDPLVPAVAAREFERQLRLLGRRYAVVPLAELRAAMDARRRGGRVPLAITFDDDLAEHVRVAAPRLRAQGLPATFFLCGASLERPHLFWWEGLELARERGIDPAGLLPPELGAEPGEPLEALARRIRHAAPAVAQRAEAGLAETLGPPRDPLGAESARTLARDFDVGFHTLRHPYLPTLDDDGLDRALRDGRPALEALAGRPLTAIAYPHGGLDARVVPAARRAGFSLGCTTESRGARGDPLAMGRVEPGPVPIGSFALRVERALRRP